MHKLRIVLLLSASLALAACSSMTVPGAYKIDIQQGNVITQEMVNKLKPGMTKNQVKFVLGTPPITDAFHQNRWDYIYSLQQGGGERQQRRLTLFFDDDKLTRIEGDIKPAEASQESPVTNPAPSGPPDSMTQGSP